MANVPAHAVAAVAAADFVMAVEPVGMARAAHDTAVPAMGADAVRTFDAAAGLFSGASGAAVPVGVMDTGLNTRHLDIGAGRRSICGANFTPLFDAREQDHDLWIDAGLHGTHTTGTILGTGAGDRRYTGMAPGVRDIRFAKVLSDVGFGDLDAILRGIDFLARPTACGGEPLKPLVVNASLGSDGVDWRARTVAERKLDAAVWNHRQLYVVANSNSGFLALGDFAAAKNSLAVGAVHDSGDVANFSSFGPTGDGRLAPLVVGTGIEVRSARGGGRRTGYVAQDGTSMAAPSVAGVATLLMDAVPALRERPAAVRARLMASAIRPDAFLDDLGAFALHNGDGPALQHRYGLGKVSARTAVPGPRPGRRVDRRHRAVSRPRRRTGRWHDRRGAAGGQPAGYRHDLGRAARRHPGWKAVLNDIDLWVDPRRPTVRRPTPAARRRPVAARQRRVADPARPAARRLSSQGGRAAGCTREAPALPRLDGNPRSIDSELAMSVSRACSPQRLADPSRWEVAVSTDGYVAAGTMLRVDCRADDSPVCSRLRWLAPKD